MEIVRILSPDAQLRLMKEKARVERNHTMIQVWALLQRERAEVRGVSIHEAANHPALWEHVDRSTSALIATMTMPAPMVEMISSFLPLPRLWDRQVDRLTRQCRVDPDVAVESTFDLIDEILEEGGFVEACEKAGVTPPTNYATWVS